MRRLLWYLFPFPYFFAGQALMIDGHGWLVLALMVILVLIGEAAASYAFTGEWNAMYHREVKDK